MPNRQRNISGRPSPIPTTPTFNNRSRGSLGRGGGMDTIPLSVLESATMEVSGTEIPVARNVENSAPPLLEATLVDTMTDEDTTTTTPIILTQPTTIDESMNTEPDLSLLEPIENAELYEVQPDRTLLHVVTQQSSPSTSNDQPSRPLPSSYGTIVQDNEILPSSLNPEDTYYGPTAPPPVIPAPFRPYFGRYTWKIFIPPSSSPYPTLMRSIQEVWDALYESDPSLIIYPWREDAATNPSLALQRVEDCPTTKEVLARYFQKAYPKAEGGSLHIGVRMGHDLSVRDLRKRFTDGLISTNRDRLGFWHRGLQHDEVVEVGWLLGSTPFMSCERLAEEIYRRSAGKVSVGCRWKYIQTDKDWSKLPESQRCKAIHIEVKMEQATPARKYLSALFNNKHRTDRVFHTPMRLVPLLSSVSGEINIAKVVHFRVRHQVFLANLRNTRIYTIGDLHLQSPRLGYKCMRDLIMAIPRNDSPKHLFYSCDEHFDGSVVLTFKVDYQAEAYNKAQNLLAYLRFTNPEYSQGITNTFMPSAQAAAVDVEWDPVTMSIVTPADLQLHMIDDIADDDPFGYDPELAQQFIAGMDIVQDSLPSALKTGRKASSIDSDSVSTIRSTKKTRFAESTKPPAVSGQSSTRRSTSRDDTSVLSGLSSDSALSRLSQVETQVSQIHEILLRLDRNQSAGTAHQGGAGTGPSS